MYSKCGKALEADALLSLCCISYIEKHAAGNTGYISLEGYSKCYFIPPTPASENST